MLDLGHLPRSTKADIQMFNVPAVAVVEFAAWIKPRGVSMSHIIACGGAGGAGAGLTGAASTSRGGGGGGGGGGVTRVTIPAIFLPDRLYLQVGAGGAGGAGASGSGGKSTFVSIAPDTSASNLVCRGWNGSFGGVGTASVGGSGGTGGAASTISESIIAGLGLFTAIAGQNGAAGGFDSNGTNETIPVTSVLCTGGPGGGGHISADTSGGTFTAIASSYLSENIPSAPATGSAGVSSGGRVLLKPLFSFGGLGGSGSNAGVGAVGAPGINGSGGGGGGGGTTGGSGGDGGNGWVIIISW